MTPKEVHWRLHEVLEASLGRFVMPCATQGLLHLLDGDGGRARHAARKLCLLRGGSHVTYEEGAAVSTQGPTTPRQVST
jgi:hypothetical protein